jgi:hypothetical protein
MSFYIDDNGNIGVIPEKIDTPDYVYMKYPKKRVLKKQLEEAERKNKAPEDVITGSVNTGDIMRDLYGF